MMKRFFFKVNVMPKETVLDPQAKTIERALKDLGFRSITKVRSGKRFHLEVEAESEEAGLALVEEISRILLSNPIIETFAIEKG